MSQEVKSIAREYQSLSRNRVTTITTTMCTMRPVPRLWRLTLTRRNQDPRE